MSAPWDGESPSAGATALPFLPTLTFQDALGGSTNQGGAAGRVGPIRLSLARLLPTLTTSSSSRGAHVRGQNATGGPSLMEVLLPTLTASADRESTNKRGEPSLRRILPTLLASDGARPLNVRGAGSIERGGGERLGDALLPTLRAHEAGCYQRDRGDPNARRPTLTGALLYPTLRASDWRSGLASDATAEKNSRPLNERISDIHGRVSGQLNPSWCEVFMGFPLDWTLPAGPPDGPPRVRVRRKSARSETPSSPSRPPSSGGSS